MPVYAETDQPPGVVGYWTAWHPRYWQFLDTLAATIVPKGTQIVRVVGDSSPAGCNMLVKAMKENPKAQWIWFLPDDHTYSPDTLMRLLNLNKDVVAPSVCRRSPPFESVAFKDVDPGGVRSTVRYDWSEIREAAIEGRLLSCKALGGSGLLIRRHVFDKVEEPYFVNLIPEQVSEDIDFTNRLYEAGVELLMEPRCSLTHLIDGALEWGFGPDGPEGEFGLRIHIHDEVYRVVEWKSAKS